MAGKHRRDLEKLLIQGEPSARIAATVRASVELLANLGRELQCGLHDLLPNRIAERSVAGEAVLLLTAPSKRFDGPAAALPCCRSGTRPAARRFAFEPAQHPELE